jgi:hypothetical protein
MLRTRITMRTRLRTSNLRSTYSNNMRNNNSSNTRNNSNSNSNTHNNNNTYNSNTHNNINNTYNSMYLNNINNTPYCTPLKPHRAIKTPWILSRPLLTVCFSPKAALRLVLLSLRRQPQEYLTLKWSHPLTLQPPLPLLLL